MIWGFSSTFLQNNGVYQSNRWHPSVTTRVPPIPPRDSASLVVGESVRPQGIILQPLQHFLTWSHHWIAWIFTYGALGFKIYAVDGRKSKKDYVNVEQRTPFPARSPNLLPWDACTCGNFPASFVWIWAWKALPLCAQERQVWTNTLALRFPPTLQSAPFWTFSIAFDSPSSGLVQHWSTQQLRTYSIPCVGTHILSRQGHPWDTPSQTLSPKSDFAASSIMQVQLKSCRAAGLDQVWESAIFLPK